MIGAIDRRVFLAAAGLSFINALNGSARAAIDRSDAVFASAGKGIDGRYKIILLDQQAQIIQQFDLPDRGHDIAYDRIHNKAVAFARRPGLFALVIDLNRNQPPQIIHAAQDRHFYGHGVFSRDGKLLFATENDYETSAGKIGIYDATDGFRRKGEFETYGIGPHEILLASDHNQLIVANGGIETHPNFGRQKLNLATMQSSMVFIDLDNGALVEKHQLPADNHQLSIRHMAQLSDGNVIFGGQQQQQSAGFKPLLGQCRVGEGIQLWQNNDAHIAEMRNYVGSVAVSEDGEKVAVSSPKGGVVTLFNAQTQQVLQQIKLEKANGLLGLGDGFVVTSERGKIGTLNAKLIQHENLLFDNHIVRLK